MNKNLRKALMIILALVFVVSLGRLGYQQIQYRQNAKAQEEAQSLAALSGLSLPNRPFEAVLAEAEALQAPDPYAEVLQNMDFKALQEVNKEVIGWILIPDTVISYPLLQGANNQYYLNHSWKKEHNLAGSIFLEHTANRALTDFNTIIYGHRMNDGSMFSTLSRYKNISYWQEHPYVYVTDDVATRRYQIFAAWEAGLTDAPYQLGLSSDRAKQAFIDACLAHSVIDTKVVPQVYDKVLTLSTCTGHGHATRWVVQAVCPGTPPKDPSPEQVPQPETTEPLSDEAENTVQPNDTPEGETDTSGAEDEPATPVEPTPAQADDTTAENEPIAGEGETPTEGDEPMATDEPAQPEEDKAQGDAPNDTPAENTENPVENPPEQAADEG